ADNPDPYVAMSHQFVAQQFWAALPQKIFFRTDTTEAVKTLAAGMAEQGIDQFLYVCYPHRDCPTPEESASALQFDLGGQLAQLDFSLLGEFGLYPIYQITSVFPET
ncbi:MAG: dolichol-phosphate mannosyltransferase, partial [Cyanobacteria bacterium J06659_2]